MTRKKEYNMRYKKENLWVLITGVVTFAIAYALASYVVCPAVNFRDVQFYCVLIFSVIASSVGIFVRRAIIVARERRVYISFDNSEFKIIGVIIGSLVANFSSS